MANSIFTRDIFGRKNYKVLPLSGSQLEDSKNDISQNPVYEDFVFKVTLGKHKGVTFRLLNLMIDEVESDDRVKMVSVIKVTKVPSKLLSNREQYLNPESEIFTDFYDHCAIPIIRDFVMEASKYATNDDDEE